MLKTIKTFQGVTTGIIFKITNNNSFMGDHRSIMGTYSSIVRTPEKNGSKDCSHLHTLK